MTEEPEEGIVVNGILWTPTSKFGVDGLERILKKIEEVGIVENVKKNYRATGTSEVNFEIHLISYDAYLLNWKDATPKLRSEVGEYVKSLYTVLKERVGVSMNDTTNPNKRSAEITFARCVLSYVLRKKYGDKLSTDEIGRIIGIDHSGVSHNYMKFGILELCEADLNNPDIAVQKCYKAYEGKRKPSFKA